MNDNATSNIKRILTSFDNFVTVIECPVWVKVATAEDLKTAFKLGCFIEKSMVQFISRDSLSEFIYMLNAWWKTKNRIKVYNEQFFQFACDKLLAKLFKSDSVMETTLDIAVRIYTSIFSKERLHTAISNLLILSSSYEAVNDFTKICLNDNDKTELEYCLKLVNWTDLLQTGRESVLREDIANNLSLYKIESSLYMLIGVLSLSDISTSEKYVQSIILENVLQKMLDRSVLSKSFWLTLFKQVHLGIICKASKNFQEFLDSLLGFIVYIGGMMEKEGDVWKSDPVASLCPEIEYHDLLAFVRNIYCSDSILRDNVINALNEAKEHTGSSIWDQIKQNL